MVLKAKMQIFERNRILRSEHIIDEICKLSKISIAAKKLHLQPRTDFLSYLYIVLAYFKDFRKVLKTPEPQNFFRDFRPSLIKHSLSALDIFLINASRLRALLLVLCNSVWSNLFTLNDRV